MAIDTSCRGHELLKIRIKDLVYKTAGDYQYAEILVNVPYVKDWIDDHPQRTNPNAHLFCGLKKTFGRVLSRYAIYDIYQHYKEKVFPKLLEDPDVPVNDKKIIRSLLQKPFNPYIQRHYSLTEKAKILKESVLRVHAGWGMNSKMPQIYLHYYGNESSESLLEAYGIITKDQQKPDPLKPKQCPNCLESCRSNDRFCPRCRMVLTYDAYSETLENQKEKEDRLTIIENQMEALLSTLGSIKDQSQVNQMAQTLFDSSILKKAVREE
jgi:hypothetical protein